MQIRRFSCKIWKQQQREAAICLKNVIMGLPPFEVSVSLVLYVGALIYAIYHAFQYGQSEFISGFLFDLKKINSLHLLMFIFLSGIDVPENENSFSEGWFAGRKRDDYDSEWESFVENTHKYVYWYICHVLLSEIVRQLEPHVNNFPSHLHQSANTFPSQFIWSIHLLPFFQRVCFIHATIGISFVWTNFKPLVIGTIFAMAFSYYLVMALRKRYVWILTVVWLAVLNMLKQSVWEERLSAILNEKELCDAMIALSWLLLRVTSFAIDYCNARTTKDCEQIEIKFSTLHYLSYSFYLPVYLHGPPLIYERYATMIPRNRLHRVEESLYRLKELMISLLRVGCVYVLNEICMHFIYANVVIYNPDVSCTENSIFNVTFFPNF